jgi:hypothetical protein
VVSFDGGASHGDGDIGSNASRVKGSNPKAKAKDFLARCFRESRRWGWVEMCELAVGRGIRFDDLLDAVEELECEMHMGGLWYTVSVPPDWPHFRMGESRIERFRRMMAGVVNAIESKVRPGTPHAPHHTFA